MSEGNGSMGGSGDASVVKLVKSETIRVPKQLVGRVVRITPLEITPRSFLESVLGKRLTDSLVGKQEATGNQPWKPFEPDPKPDLPIPNPDYDDEEENYR